MSENDVKVTPEYLDKSMTSWARWLAILACIHLGVAVLSFIGQENGNASRFVAVQFGSAILVFITAFFIWKRNILLFLSSGFYFVLSFLSPLILGQQYELFDLLLLLAPVFFYRTMYFFGKHGVFNKKQIATGSQDPV